MRMVADIGNIAIVGSTVMVATTAALADRWSIVHRDRRLCIVVNR